WLNTFHYRSYGTFFYTQKGSIISMVDLPTTEIIEPEKLTPREDEIRSLFFISFLFLGDKLKRALPSFSLFKASKSVSSS
ncbi:hypothetical protein NOL38_10025, partial [Streptococcus suis]|nr:hypothetical protein [Streptococcus suis]